MYMLRREKMMLRSELRKKDSTYTITQAVTVKCQYLIKIIQLESCEYFTVHIIASIIWEMHL